MKLSVQFPELGTMLMKQLLKGPGEKGRTRGPVVNLATVELIYQLGKKQDSSFEDSFGNGVEQDSSYEDRFGKRPFVQTQGFFFVCSW